MSGWPITLYVAKLNYMFLFSCLPSLLTSIWHCSPSPPWWNTLFSFLLRTRFSSCFCGLFCLAVFSGSNLTKFWILKFLIAWHWVLFIFSLHYIPIALKTIYMLITPKFISWARLFPQCFFFIYPNYLLGNSTCVFLKCLKLNVLNTKLLLLPMETYFSMDLLSLSKWYVILPDCCNKNLIAGLPWWRSGWESACQCRGHGFEPWSGRIPHAVERLGPWATATEPERLEPLLRNKRGRDSERPTHRDEEWPPLAAAGEGPRTETKTQHSQK